MARRMPINSIPSGARSRRGNENTCTNCLLGYSGDDHGRSGLIMVHAIPRTGIRYTQARTNGGLNATYRTLTVNRLQNQHQIARVFAAICSTDRNLHPCVNMFVYCFRYFPVIFLFLLFHARSSLAILRRYNFTIHSETRAPGSYIIVPMD